MLQINKSSLSLKPESGNGGPAGGAADSVRLSDTIKAVAAIVGRQFPLFLVIVPCAAVLGAVWLLITPPAFTAVAKMLIDTHKVLAVQQPQTTIEQPIDNVAVATQVEVLTSENVSLSVIRDLKLTEDPEFTGPGAGPIGALLDFIANWFDSSAAHSESRILRRALAAFEARRKVIRIPQTYAVEIEFWSHDPHKAAQIANAISEAYIVDQLDAKYQSARRASTWLQDRIKTLRAEATAASQAVVDFKVNNHIIESGGKLMTEQQMSEVETQLILARAHTAEAKARLDRITQVMSKDIPEASVADALNNQVVVKLRGQYLDLAAREAIWSKKYGPDHLATINLRNQMQEIRRTIADEMQKIAESYKSDYEIARTREASIQKSLDDTVTQSQITNQAQVQLRELESKAQTARNMYDNFLQRYMEAVQQQSFPVSEARLISPASSPRSKSYPNPPIVMALSVLGGMMLAFGAAMLREGSSRTFCTGAQVQTNLHVGCIATLPLLRLEPDAGGAAAHLQEDATSASQPRRIKRPNELLFYAAEAPFSQFTELLRSLKVAADLGGPVQPNRVIGVTSTLPGEGKSTIAANFAVMIAHAGARAILVDADLRKSTLSRSLAPGAETGVLEVAAGQMALADAIWTDAASGLAFLPVGSQSAKLLHPNEVLASAGIRAFIDKLRNTFEYVIVDLTPLAPVVDARTTINYIDSYLYVVEWNRTNSAAVKYSLSAAPEIYDRLLGVVLNKAEMSVVRRYEPYVRSYYYSNYSADSDNKFLPENTKVEKLLRWLGMRRSKGSVL